MKNNIPKLKESKEMKAKKAKQKKNYNDVLMETSRFPELRFRREFTEFMSKHFAAEAAAKCLAIKTKYKLIGKSITPEAAVDICLKEGMYIDVDPENSVKNSQSWFGKSKDGAFLLWIDPDLSVDAGQDLVIFGLAAFLLTQYHDTQLKGDTYKNLDELVKKGEKLFRAVLTVEVLKAMLLSQESKSELTALLLEPAKGTNKASTSFLGQEPDEWAEFLD